MVLTMFSFFDILVTMVTGISSNVTETHGASVNKDRILATKCVFVVHRNYNVLSVSVMV